MGAERQTGPSASAGEIDPWFWSGAPWEVGSVAAMVHSQRSLQESLWSGTIPGARTQQGHLRGPDYLDCFEPLGAWAQAARHDRLIDQNRDSSAPTRLPYQESIALTSKDDKCHIHLLCSDSRCRTGMTPAWLPSISDVAPMPVSKFNFRQTFSTNPTINCARRPNSGTCQHSTQATGLYNREGNAEQRLSRSGECGICAPGAQRKLLATLSARLHPADGSPPMRQTERG